MARFPLKISKDDLVGIPRTVNSIRKIHIGRVTAFTSKGLNSGGGTCSFLSGAVEKFQKSKVAFQVVGWDGTGAYPPALLELNDKIHVHYDHPLESAPSESVLQS